MSRLRMLAASPRPLVDVLIDLLRSSSSLSRLRPILSDEDNDGSDQFSLQLDDERGEEYVNNTIRVLHPDDAAVAALFGQAFEHSRDVLARLRDPDMVAIIEVPHTDLVEPVARLLRKHVLGPETRVLDGDGLDKQATAAPGGTVVLFKRTDEANPRKALAGGVELAAAVQLRCSIIAITADTSQFPRELLVLAEHHINVPPLDGAAIAAVIEAVTGKRPVSDDVVARHATLQMLSIAVRADLGAERSMTRLNRLVGARPPKEPGFLLSEMHGLGAAQKFGLELVADLHAYIAGTLPWSACPRGLLVTGPSGTGKTSYARSLCAEVGGHFSATSYSAWQNHREGHLGNVTAAIRNTFLEANKIFRETNKPVIVFIDEIDSLPTRGSGDDRSNQWWTPVVNTLLEQLDGFERREGVVVIAACNDPSRLDPALIRAGRLDHHIAIPLPDVPALIGIFRMHLGKDLEGIDLREAALAARGHTGADVERWVRVARRVARTADRAPILQDLIDAVRSGQPQLPADIRRRVAVHEAGHAIAVLALGVAEPKSLSIGGSGGLAENDGGEMKAETRANMEQLLVAFLGGRAAEQLIFGEVTAGAGGVGSPDGNVGSDLGRATRLAMRLETDFGLGSLGLVCLAGDIKSRDLLLFGDLRAAVEATIDRAYSSALELLAQHRSALEGLAAALFAAGYLDRAEIEAALAGTSLGSSAISNSPARVQPRHNDSRSDAAVGGTGAPPFISIKP